MVLEPLTFIKHEYTVSLRRRWIFNVTHGSLIGVGAYLLACKTCVESQRGMAACPNNTEKHVASGMSAYNCSLPLCSDQHRHWDLVI